MSLRRRLPAAGRWSRLSFAIVVAGVALVLLETAASHAAAPVIRSYTVDAPDRLTVGDHFTVTIVVEAEAGTQIQIAPGGIAEELALAQSPRLSTRGRGPGKIEVTMEIVLAAFVVGDYSMPPITLRYTDAAGVTGQVQTPASRLTIDSTLGGGVPRPRDLKPQAEIGEAVSPPYELVAVAAGALALALGLLFVAWRRLQRLVPVPVAIEPEPQALGPEDAARRALDSAGARFASDQDYPAYYAVLSTTVRDYLTYRFGFPAFALTTVEMRAQMTRRGVDRWQARLVGGLLEQCDAVIFASYRPATERADADLTAAYEIVEMSRPIEAPEEVAIS